MRKRDFDRFLARLEKAEGVKFVRVIFTNGDMMLAEPYLVRYVRRGVISVFRMPTSSRFTVPADLNAVSGDEPCPVCWRSQAICHHIRYSQIQLRLRDIKSLEAVQGMTFGEVKEVLQNGKPAFYRMARHGVEPSYLSVRGEFPFLRLFEDRSGARPGGFGIRDIWSIDEVVSHYDQIVGRRGFFLGLRDAQAEILGAPVEDLEASSVDSLEEFADLVIRQLFDNLKLLKVAEEGLRRALE